MHFLEAAQFLNAPVLAGRKVKFTSCPGLAARPPPTRADFDAGQRHYLGNWKGRALKIKTFLGPEMATSAGKFSLA